MDARLGRATNGLVRAELMTTSGRVSRSRSSTCAPERTTPPVDRSRASRSTRRGTRPRWRRARRSAPALGQNSISPSLGLAADANPKTRSNFCRFVSSRASAKKSARLPRETPSKNILMLMRVDESVSGVRITTEAARAARLSHTLFCVLVFFCMHGRMARARRREGTRFLVERASLSFFFPTVKRRRLTKPLKTLRSTRDEEDAGLG